MTPILQTERKIANGDELGNIPIVVYYAKVALEVSKIVARNQKMAPP